MSGRARVETWCAASGKPAPKFERPECEAKYGIPAFFPAEQVSELAPDGAEFVGAVAWSFRPGSERREGFYIAPSPKRGWTWILWVFAYDDNWMKWDWELRACTRRKLPDAKDAAVFLMRESWRAEKKEWHTGMFDEIERDGLMEESELEALGEETLG